MIDAAVITRKRELLPPNDPRFGTHDRRDEVIVGVRLEIGAGQVCDRFFNCRFRDCEVSLRGPGRLVQVATRGVTFDDCLIRAAKIQKIPNWEAAFHRCYFLGKIEARFSGPVKDCDFSAAGLNQAAFLQSESLGEVVWPSWPHVVIESPISNYADWKTIQKPADFNQYLVMRSGVATVFNIANEVDDPDAFWERIREKQYIHSRRDP